jgi:hypothetical protein
MLLNIVLVASLVWPQWLAPNVRAGGWLMVLGIWFTSTVVAGRWCRNPADRDRRNDGGARAETGELSSPQDTDLFREAQTQYLQGNWFDAERLLDQLTRRNPGDADVHLLRATLCRHTGRLDEAAAGLQQLERLEDAQQWQWEIKNEWACLSRARDVRAARTDDPPSP